MGRGRGSATQPKAKLRSRNAIETTLKVAPMGDRSDYQMYRTAFQNYVNGMYKWGSDDLITKAKHWQDLLNVMDRIDPQIAAEVMAVVSMTRDMQVITTQTPVRSKGKATVNKTLLQAESDYLAEHYPDLYEQFDMGEYDKLIGDMMRVGGYSASWAREDAKKVEQAVRLNQLATADRLLPLVKDQIPEKINQPLVKCLEKIRQAAYEDNEISAALVDRAHRLRIVALYVAAFADPDSRGVVTDRFANWQDRLSAIEPADKQPKEIFEMDLALIQEAHGTATLGFYQIETELMAVASSLEDNDQNEHLAVHELVHSRQPQLTRGLDTVYQDREEAMAYRESMDIPTLEGLTELATHYLHYGQVDFSRGTAYPSYVLAAQCLQEACQKDNDWMIEQAFISAKPVDVLQAAFRTSHEKGVVQSLFNRLVNDLSDSIDTVDSGAVRSDSSISQLPSYTADQIKQIERKRKQLSKNFASQLASYGYYHI